MGKSMIIKSLFLFVLLYFSFTFSSKAFFERIVIGKDTLCLVAYPLQADSVLSVRIQERLSGTYSTACRRGYQGIWRLENDTLFLEKIVDYYNLTKPDAKEVIIDLEGIFDDYKRGGRIAASWYSGTLKVLGGKCITEQASGFLGRYEREWIYEVERGRVTSRQECQNFLKKAHPMAKYNMDVVATMFNGDRFPELADKCLFFEAAVTPKADGSIDSMDIKIAVVDKDSNQYKYRKSWKWIKNDFSNPYIQELKTCLELIPGWDYLVLDNQVKTVRTWDAMTAWEGKGCKARYELGDPVFRNRPDTLRWKDADYLLYGYPLQYDMNLYARLRPLLESGFSPECLRGYTARWQIRNDCLYLQSLHHGKDGSNIPLESVFQGNKGKAVKATWYTGKLLLPLGGTPRNYYGTLDVSPRIIHDEEIICDVREGKVVGETTYRNVIRMGDFESYIRSTREIADFNWDKFPELRGKELKCSYRMYPREDGTADSICVVLDIIGTQERNRKQYARRITDPDHPYLVICRNALDKVTTWDVVFIRGKMETVEKFVYIKRRKSGLRISECDLKNFDVRERGAQMLWVEPKNHKQVIRLLNGKGESRLPYKESPAACKPWEIFRTWLDEIKDKCIPAEVSDMIRREKSGADRYSWPLFKVFLFIDRVGKIHSVNFLMSDNVYMALTEDRLQAVYDALMREELSTINTLFDFDADREKIDYGIFEFSLVEDR